jgi:hypothetical protein
MKAIEISKIVQGSKKNNMTTINTTKTQREETDI